MPKSSRDQIDFDEKKIIDQLKKDSKESIDKIAKKCGFSRQKVWRVVKRLEKNKIIWGYHAVVDDEKINRKRYLMLLKRSNTPLGNTIGKIIDFSINQEGKDIGVDILCSSYLHGQYDWVFVLSAENIKDAKKFSELLSREYHNTISEIVLLEDIFTIMKCHIINPNIEKIHELFD